MPTIENNHRKYDDYRKSDAYFATCVQLRKLLEKGMPMKKAGVLLVALWYALAFFAGRPFLPYPHAVAFHTALALFQAP